MNGISIKLLTVEINELIIIDKKRKNPANKIINEDMRRSLIIYKNPEGLSVTPHIQFKAFFNITQTVVEPIIINVIAIKVALNPEPS